MVTVDGKLMYNFVFSRITGLFDVTQKGNSAQRPVSRVAICLKVDRADVFGVGPLRFPVNWTLVEPRIFPRSCVYSKYVDDRHLFV